MWITHFTTNGLEGTIAGTSASRQVRPRRPNIGHENNRRRLATAIAAATIAFFLIAPAVSATELSYRRLPWEALHVKPVQVKPKTTSATLASEQEAWLDDLVQCESRGNAAAINPKDRDGTPSYGLLQFKPSTFAEFSKAYGIGDPAEYMDPEAQKEIVLRMMRDPSVRWSVQFPVCVSILGNPPGAVS